MNIKTNTAKEQFEIARLQECERAWQQVFDLCMAQDPEFSGRPGTSGVECVLTHIKALGNQTKIVKYVA